MHRMYVLISAAQSPWGLEDGVTPIMMLGVAGAMKQNSPLGCQAEAECCQNASTRANRVNQWCDCVPLSDKGTLGAEKGRLSFCTGHCSDSKGGAGGRDSLFPAPLFSESGTES